MPDEEGSCNGGPHGSIVTAADGTLYVPKRMCEGFLLAKSSDSAMTWTTKKVGVDWTLNLFAAR